MSFLRSIWHKAECTAASVFVKESGGRFLGDGCVDSSLAKEVVVCLPSVSINPKITVETIVEGEGSCSGGSFLAETVLVPDAEEFGDPGLLVDSSFSISSALSHCASIPES